MTSDLLPCPFCGGPATMRDELHYDNITWDYWVTCYNDDCDKDCATSVYRTEAEAIAAWNTRPAPALPEIVAAAEAWVEAERTIFHAGSERQADEAAHGITAARTRFLSLLTVHFAEVERLRNGVTAIKLATVEGRVCDDVAWFDTITTLYDFCDELLRPCASATHEKKEG